MFLNKILKCLTNKSKIYLAYTNIFIIKTEQKDTNLMKKTVPEVGAEICIKRKQLRKQVPLCFLPTRFSMFQYNYKKCS